MQKNNYLLIDVLNLVFRVFHSVAKFQNIDTEEKQLQNIDLFVKIILKNILGNRNILVNKYNDLGEYIPTKNIVLAFDSYSWRRDFLRNDETTEMSDDDYKAGRNKSNDHIIKLITNRLEEVVSNIGMNVVKVDKFEADDIIFLLPETDIKYNTDNKYVVISNDDDFTQMTINENVLVFNPNTNAFNLKNGVMALTTKILKGDKSDAIENPYFPLKLDSELISTIYGEVTILSGLNGNFSCTCPNDLHISVSHENGILEVTKTGNNGKEVIFSSDKVKIQFDKNYQLHPELKLKFEKDTPVEEQEKTISTVTYLLNQIKEHGNDVFELSDNHIEDFVLNTIQTLTSKYKKTHFKYIKDNYPDLSNPEKKEKSQLFWISDLVEWNKELFNNEDILEFNKLLDTLVNKSSTTKEQQKVLLEKEDKLHNILTDVFKNNLQKNEILINSEFIPDEYRKHFNEVIYPDILTPTLKSKKEILDYLDSIKFHEVSKIFANDKDETPSQEHIPF